MLSLRFSTLAQTTGECEADPQQPRPAACANIDLQLWKGSRERMGFQLR